jgi:hypothetical protein
MCAPQNTPGQLGVAGASPTSQSMIADGAMRQAWLRGNPLPEILRCRGSLNGASPIGDGDPFALSSGQCNGATQETVAPR